MLAATVGLFFLFVPKVSGDLWMAQLNGTYVAVTGRKRTLFHCM